MNTELDTMVHLRWGQLRAEREFMQQLPDQVVDRTSQLLSQAYPDITWPWAEKHQPLSIVFWALRHKEQFDVDGCLRQALHEYLTDEHRS